MSKRLAMINEQCTMDYQVALGDAAAFHGKLLLANPLLTAHRQLLVTSKGDL